MRLHIADGAAGQMGPQAQLVPALALVVSGQPVGVHALPGGMVGREVQVVEAVQLAGDVVLLIDLKAHGAEGVVQVVAHLGNGVQAAAGGQYTRHGDIEVGIDLGRLHLQLVAALIQQLGQLGLGLIHRLAHLRTQGHVQLGQLLQQLRQAALLAQQQRLDLLQLRLGADGLDPGPALGEQLFQFLFHYNVMPPFESFASGDKKTPFIPHDMGRKATLPWYHPASRTWPAHSFPVNGG